MAEEENECARRMPLGDVGAPGGGPGMVGDLWAELALPACSTKVGGKRGSGSALLDVSKSWEIRDIQLIVSNKAVLGAFVACMDPE